MCTLSMPREKRRDRRQEKNNAIMCVRVYVTIIQVGRSVDVSTLMDMYAL